MRNVAIELLRISTVGGVEVADRFRLSVEGGGGLSRPTSSSSLVHFSRPPLLALLPPPPPSMSLQSRGSPLESALEMLRFCGDMQTSGPLHSSDDDDDDEVEVEAAVVVVVAVVGGSGVRVATLPPP